MKILFEKNLTPTVFILKNDKGEKFCGSCAMPVSMGTIIGSIKCPRCNSKLYDTEAPTKKELFVTRVTISESGDKLLMNVFTNKNWLYKNKFRFTKYIHPFVFNFKTGQSYELPVINGDTKQVLKIKNNGIKNISYGSASLNKLISWRMESEIIEIFKNKAREYLKYEDEFIKFNNSDTGIRQCRIANVILSLVKYKYVNEETMSVFSCYYEELKNIRKFWLKPNFKKNAEKALKLKFCKEAWETIDGNFLYLYDCLSLGKLKVDNQNKIINASKSLFDIGFNPNCSYRASALAEFVSLFENENAGTNRVIKLLEDDNNIRAYEIKDAARMLITLKESEISIKNILKMKTLKDIHDKATEEYKKLKTVNRVINLTDNQKKLNDSCDEVEFKVCTETSQLDYIGDKMHHCVASYADDAVAKRCTIIGATKNNRLFACIEIRNNNILQAKGYCNQKLSKEDLIMVRSWANKKGLRYDNCRDLM